MQIVSDKGSDSLVRIAKTCWIRSALLDDGQPLSEAEESSVRNFGQLKELAPPNALGQPLIEQRGEGFLETIKPVTRNLMFCLRIKSTWNGNRGNECAIE